MKGDKIFISRHKEAGILNMSKIIQKDNHKMYLSDYEWSSLMVFKCGITAMRFRNK